MLGLGFGGMLGLRRLLLSLSLLLARRRGEGFVRLGLGRLVWLVAFFFFFRLEREVKFSVFGVYLEGPEALYYCIRRRG